MGRSMYEMIQEKFALKDGEEDNWKNGLVPDGDRLAEYLGNEDESPVYRGMKEAGEYLLRARRTVAEIERDPQHDPEALKREDIHIPDHLADEVCEAMSCFARTPYVRFYCAFFAVQRTVTQCIAKRTPENFSHLPWTDAQYHAVVSYCHMNQVGQMMGLIGNNSNGNDNDNEDDPVTWDIIRSFKACIKARPKDAKIYVTFGNWLMVNRFTQDAREHLEKAIELDEEGCFASHYTLANMMNNAVPDMHRVNNELSPLEKLQAKCWTEGCQIHSRKYLDLAPVGHWHRHRAFINLISMNIKLTARGSEKIHSIEKRNPGFCAEQLDLFQKATESLKLYVNCFGREESDFRSLYKQASAIVSLMHREGLTGADSQAPESEYICGNPACTARAGGKKALKLSKCSRCLSVRYCGKNCQAMHWKNGHKKECKRMAREYEAHRKIERVRRPYVEPKQVGDDDLDELFKAW